MKKAPPVFGFQQTDYQLLEILHRYHAKHIAAVQNRSTIQKASDGSVASMQRQMGARVEDIQTGVISVIMAVAYLEWVIYDYGTSFIHFESFDKHLGRLDIVSKWIVIPDLCQGIEISEESSQINDLRELVKARNSVIHSKQKWLTIENPLPVNESKESLRFTAAAKNAMRTVEGLIDILKSKQKAGGRA